MYCRKCMKETDSKTREPKKINMEVDLDGQFYLCPECGHVVTWSQEEEK